MKQRERRLYRVGKDEEEEKRREKTARCQRFKDGEKGH